MLLQLVQRAHAAFASGKTRDLEFRRHSLQQMLRMYEDHTTDMLEALDLFA
jgi:hypothetical protein